MRDCHYLEAADSNPRVVTIGFEIAASLLLVFCHKYSQIVFDGIYFFYISISHHKIVLYCFTFDKTSDHQQGEPDWHVVQTWHLYHAHSAG